MENSRLNWGWTFSQGRLPFDGDFEEACGGSEYSLRIDGEQPNRAVASFADVGTFDIDFAKREVSVHAATNVTAETVRHFLADQMFPRILAHQGQLVLHAGAVEWRNGAVLFVGGSGTGKSTLTASLHVSGWSLIGDDAIVVTCPAGEILTRAVYRSLRLSADSLAELMPDSHGNSAAHYSGKRSLELPDASGDFSLPLRAVFLLQSPIHNDIIVEPISGAEAGIAFVEHSFSLDPTDPRSAKQRIVLASVIGSQIPTFRLSYPRDYSLLPNIHKAIAGVLD